jgi:hypothetical protein
MGRGKAAQLVVHAGGELVGGGRRVALGCGHRSMFRPAEAGRYRD